MISVSDALSQLFALTRVLEVEEVPLSEACGRVLARDLHAGRDQPPFAASAMDGYALSSAAPGAVLTLIGEAAAGRGFAGTVSDGQAVRILTGAPLPEGARRVVIQEDVTRVGDQITLSQDLDTAQHIRPAGGDFQCGEALRAPRVLSPHEIALLAAMNVALVPVTRRPKVALISTGDELVMPGDTPGPDQILASNSFGLQAMLRDLGALPRLLPIARDTAASLKTVFRLAEGADLIVTIGGASVGDHDLVAPVAAEMGLQQSFHKVAMRPGKPLMSGRFGDAMMIGLPGNPVSALVCGHVFLAPVIRAFLGLGQAPAPLQTAPLLAPVAANGPRAHYMRGRVDAQGLKVFERQDSSLLTVLAEANALILRPPLDGPRGAGEMLDYLPI